jgi:hypothetical protein
MAKLGMQDHLTTEDPERGITLVVREITRATWLGKVLKWRPSDAETSSQRVVGLTRPTDERRGHGRR